MPCSNCTLVHVIPSCIDNIILGSISDTGEDVYVYFKNLSTGRVTRLEASSDPYGSVNVDVSDFEPMADHPYEVWITLKDATSVEEKETITINDVDHDCLLIKFDLFHEEDGSLIDLPSTVTVKPYE